MPDTKHEPNTGHYMQMQKKRIRTDVNTTKEQEKKE